MKKYKINKVISITLLALIMINFVLPIKSYAHDAYFFQVLIDENTMTYLGNIVPDRASRMNYEKKHIEAELWEFEPKHEHDYMTNYDVLDGNTNGKDSMAFTFPSKEIRNPKNNVTAKDIDRMYEIRDTLIPNLNDTLRIMNDGKKFDDIDELIEASEVIIKTGTYNGWEVKHTGDNLILTNKNTNETYEYLMRMIKGYKNSKFEDGRDSYLYNPNLDYSDDIEYISIPLIIMQGNYTYIVKGHTADQSGEYTKPGTLEVKLSELLTSMINGVRSLLGLYSINELIYNQGTRDSRSFYGGIMSNEWMKKTTAFHMIFQAIAWIIIVLAILKLLFQRNLATINPNMRVSLIEGIKDLLLTGFMLLSSFLLLNTLLRLNEKIVSIFSTTIPDYAAFTGVSNDYQTFSGSLLQLYYLFITIYLNFVYIVRGITVSVLIASAPLFIVSIAFESKGKRLFTTWIKELVANIFLQSFHAFVLSLFVSIQMSTRGIELAIVSFALIPITAFFKSLILGESGNLAGNLGMQAVSMGASAVGGFIGGNLSNKDNSGNFQNSTNNSEGGDIKTKKLPNKKTTTDSLNNMETNLGEDLTNNEKNNYEKLSSRFPTSENIKDTISGIKGTSAKVVDSLSAGNRKDTFNNIKEAIGEKIGNTGEAINNMSFAEGVSNIGKAITSDTSKQIGTTAKNLAVGGTKVAAGAAMTMALGGNDGKTSNKLIASGAGNIKNGSKSGLNLAGNALSLGGKKVFDTLTGGNVGGNIIGAETLNNGDTVISRDKNMVNNDGLSNVTKTSDNTVAFTYNKNKLNEGNRKMLEQIEDKYKEGNIEYLKARGIDRVGQNGNGDTIVHYNQLGQRNLGFKDIYETGNRIVETKAPGQKLDTRIIYDIFSTKPAPPSANYDNYTVNNKDNNTLDMDSRM